MSEATGAAAVSAALSARVAAVAVRLADLLQALSSETSGGRETADFLRSWAATAAYAGEQQVRAAPAQPLDVVAGVLGLTDQEVDLLLLAGLPEEHEGLAATMRQCHPLELPRPSVGLAALLTQDAAGSRAALRTLLAEGAAVRSGLLRVEGDVPLFDRSLAPAEGIWEALHGVDGWPGRLARVQVPPAPPGLDGWLALPSVQRAVELLGDDRSQLLLVPSTDEAVALSRVSRLLQAAGRRPIAARLDPDDTDALDLLSLHALARGGSVPVAVICDVAEGRRAPVLRPGRVPGPILVCAAPGSVQPAADRPIRTVPLGPVGSADRRAAWRAALPGAPERAGDLAGRHPLDPAFTAQVARDLGAGPGPGGAALDADIAAAIRARAGVVLPAGVDLRSPRAGWDDLVLEDEPLDQLRDAVSRLDHQGLVLDDWGLESVARADRGVRLLFTGPPGTGKSLAAEVLAAACATDLLVVDASRVVSKWVGETEKNLAAVFDVAERTQAVLLLDEADGLFATRTDVEDSNDRYANLQTAWLLQRLDHFDGLAVLATNMRRSIDVAFVRRMDFVVEFALPDVAQREAIWDRHLPRRQRARDVDAAELARCYPVSGGWIRNAAIAAAFRAAARDGVVRAADVVAAVRREYAKASKPYPGAPKPPPIVVDERAAQLLSASVAGAGTQEVAP